MTAASVSVVRSHSLPRTKDSVGLGDVLAFLVPSVLAVNFQITGRIFLSEIILISALPFLLASTRVAHMTPWTKAVVAAGLLWLWAQVVTDLYRSTVFADLARGWLNIGFSIADFVAILILLAGQKRRILLFTAGLAAGYASAYRFNPSPYSDVDPWKFGVAIPVTLLIVLLSCYAADRRFRLLSAGLLFVAGFVNFLFGFRSLGGVCLLAGIYLVAQGVRRRQLSSTAGISRAKLITISALGVVLGLLLIAAYGHAARDGFLGAPAGTKYRQESTGRFGVLLGGRPEILASSKAIADSPLIGHGSWAKDPKYTNELLSLLYRNGYRPSGGLLYTIQQSKYLIPSHSYFFGAWVEAGVFGAVFWLAVLALVVSSLGVAFTRRPPLSPLIAFLGSLLLWNLLFSPYGGDQRILAMFSVAVLITSCYAPDEKPLKGVRLAADRTIRRSGSLVRSQGVT
jgi:hypothetical protein